MGFEYWDEMLLGIIEQYTIHDIALIILSYATKFDFKKTTPYLKQHEFEEQQEEVE